MRKGEGERGRGRRERGREGERARGRGRVREGEKRVGEEKKTSFNSIINSIIKTRGLQEGEGKRGGKGEYGKEMRRRRRKLACRRHYGVKENFSGKVWQRDFFVCFRYYFVKLDFAFFPGMFLK